MEDEYGSAKRTLTLHFFLKKNLNFEIFNFRQAKQQNHESLDQFYARLLKLSVTKMMRSNIILTKTSSNLRQYGRRGAKN